LPYPLGLLRQINDAAPRRSLAGAATRRSDLMTETITSSDSISTSKWWQRESHRDFTSLERGLLGALFVAIAMMALMLVRYLMT
jgi:hypothetical protein